MRSSFYVVGAAETVYWLQKPSGIDPMPSWLLKAAVQRFISGLPNPHYWNELFQTRITHSLRLTSEEFERKLGQCRIHLQHLRRYNPSSTNGFSALELGTGWFPVVPVGLFLSGAREVWTWDITPHVSLSRLKAVLEQFTEVRRTGELSRHLPGLVPERLKHLRKVAADHAKWANVNEAFQHLAIHYVIGDAKHTALPDGSVDLLTSVSVLEYISMQALVELYREFRRIAAQHAVMSHWILFADQYAFFDRRITPFNYLRYSDQVWRWLSSPMIPLSRLRITDHRLAMRNGSFRIVDEEVEIRGDPEVLARIRLAPRFRGYPLDDLLVLGAWLVAMPA
jgi:hypothetical protein